MPSHKINNPNIASQLDKSIIEIRKRLHLCKVYIECDWQIGQKAKSLNKGGFGSFFGYCQKAFLDMLVVEITSIFSTEDKWETHSIPYIIKILPDHELVNRDAFQNALTTRMKIKLSSKLDKMGDKDYINKIVIKLNNDRPTENNSEELKQIKNIRNKRVAHNSVEEVSSSFLPSLESFSELCNYTESLINTICDGYLPTWYEDDYKKPARKLETIINKILQ